MPAWVPRAILLFFVGVIALWLLQRLFEDLSGFLVTILISFFFSFALEPAVNWLERKGFAAASARSSCSPSPSPASRC